MASRTICLIRQPDGFLADSINLALLCSCFGTYCPLERSESMSRRPECSHDFANRHAPLPDRKLVLLEHNQPNRSQQLIAKQLRHRSSIAIPNHWHRHSLL